MKLVTIVIAVLFLIAVSSALVLSDTGALPIDSTVQEDDMTCDSAETSGSPESATVRITMYAMDDE